MLLKNEIKIGETYAWDIDDMISSIHPGTITVKILGIAEHRENSCLVTVESVQTSELFNTDSGHLTTLDRVEKMLEAYQNIILTENNSYSYNKKINKMIAVSNLKLMEQVS